MPTTFHQRKRKALAGWPPADIDPEMRFVCKLVNSYRGVCTTKSCAGHAPALLSQGRKVGSIAEASDAAPGKSGYLHLHLSRRLRIVAEQLAAALMALEGNVSCCMRYGEAPWPEFAISFDAGRAYAVGDVIIDWLSEVTEPEP